ncbi:hypothetical protein [Catenulispora rubra]|uniref:hypothetical protein n=1 Tax=Catenulispora rubra TaxID=280293 RepID=UPI001892067B|nr:hypothetical protein [Catenulispora rubra]
MIGSPTLLSIVHIYRGDDASDLGRWSAEVQQCFDDGRSSNPVSPSIWTKEPDLSSESATIARGVIGRFDTLEGDLCA